MISILDPQHFPDFKTAAVAVLAFLRTRLDFALWMITRTDGLNCLVAHVEDSRFGMQEGSSFKWSDGLCSQMVAGNGPRIAPRSDSVPAYARAPLRLELGVESYLGVPLLRADGSLYGTLCAMDSSPQPETISAELPLVELLASMLSSLLAAEDRAGEHSREVDRARLEAMSDSLTGLYNRRGWDERLAAEESRCARYGNSACVIAVDLNDLKLVNDAEGHASGDDLIRRAADALRASVRRHDIVARVGGDEFAVLSVECDHDSARLLLLRLQDALAKVAVSASLGLALRNPTANLEQAWRQADAAMYARKRQADA